MTMTKTTLLPRTYGKRDNFTKYSSSDNAFIKKLIWTYFLLLLFEGALRKWFFTRPISRIANCTRSNCNLGLLPKLFKRTFSNC